MKKKERKNVKSAVTDKPLSSKAPLNPECIFLLVLGLVFYLNTCFNEYTLDDHLVITKNTYTQQGLAGIGNLITKPSYHGFFKNSKEEASLRYRPLVMVTYALECELIKNKNILVFFSHLVNVILFLITIFIIYKLLSGYLLPDRPGLVFLTTLLFTIHPIHTESVANIKGRDELMSFLFAMAAAWYLLKHIHSRKLSFLFGSLLFYTAGLLSKENTVSFLLVFPLMIYFFTPVKMPEVVKKSMPYLLITVVYVIIRFSVTGWSSTPSAELLNNPFLNATADEKYATILFCLGYYIKLLFFPHPLSYDYTYNQIRLTGFDDPLVWVSLLLHLTLTVVAIIGFRKKNIISFGILFYMATLALVSNLFINLGAFIGERLIYTPSFGFCLVTAGLLYSVYSRLNMFNARGATLIRNLFLTMLILLSGFKTISRNADWKNNFTLMTHDVKSSPESMKANDACAINLILASDEPGISEGERKALLTRAIQHDHKAVEILPTFTDLYFNLGTSFSRLEMTDSAEYFWNIARSQKPDHPKFSELNLVLGQQFLKRGLQRAIDKDMKGSLEDLARSVHYLPQNTDAWYNYGGASFSVGQYEQARLAFEKVLQLDPSHQEARQGLMSAIAGKK